MNDEELFETELKRLKPARAPEELMGRLVAVGLARTNLVETRSGTSRERTLAKAGAPNGFGWLRWLVPATALAGAVCLVALVLSRDATHAVKPSKDSVKISAVAPLKADDVQIDRCVAICCRQLRHLNRSQLHLALYPGNHFVQHLGQ